MGTTMNRTAFEGLIKENITWLRQQPHCCERDHIEAVLLGAADFYYGKPVPELPLHGPMGVGPEDFPGTDEGSHFMSQTDFNKKEAGNG